MTELQKAEVSKTLTERYEILQIVFEVLHLAPLTATTKEAVRVSKIFQSVLQEMTK